MRRNTSIVLACAVGGLASALAAAAGLGSERTEMRIE